MNKARLAILIVGIPGLLGYGSLVAAQWRSAEALTAFAAYQKIDPPNSLKPPKPELVARKELALLRAARYGPGNPEPLYQLALLKMASAEAESLSPSSPAESNGSNDPPRPLRGLLCEALSSANQAMERNPGGADTYFVKAMVLQNLSGVTGRTEGDTESRAIFLLLRTADRLDPYQPSLHFRMGSFWLALGNREEAKRAFMVALRDISQYARPIFDMLWSSAENVAEMRVLIGEDPLARALLGDFLWTRGFTTDAEREYSQAELGRPMTFAVYELLVEQNLRTQQYDRVRRDLSALLENSKELTVPELARAHYFEGQSYYLESRFQDSISSFERVLQIDPTLYYVHQALGNAYSQTGDLDRAVARLQFVLGKTGNTLPPKDAASLRVDLATVYEKKRLYLEALDQYFRAAQLDPTNRVAVERAAELGRQHL
jgi:tetratricopeptide (TPR) repeat protein